MDHFIQSFSTGVIQGTTEFLPVSSSGHLFLLRNFFQMNFGTDYVVLLHLGTLIAVMFFFWKDIWHILKGMLSKDMGAWRIFISLVIGTIPAAISGLLLEDWLEIYLTSNWVIGVSLIITGLLLFLTDRFPEDRTGLKEVGIKKALIIGLFQAIAIVPGLSRSGLTLFGSLLVGLKREDAFKFSFLLSIPVILGGTLLKINQITQTTGGGMGFLFAAVSGFFSLWLLRFLTKAKKLKYFAFYCWIIGILSIVIS
ncbi:MAG TPA: undecaprenyl-diphosphate phosphatase [Thermotogota bacterium]|nr:undecaprenyl-diphosphate phosphatase [Thermotogota bacterium]HRW33969.1 undecaprenyl-diphosphate phosphatase [Thermotogota bacterium]